jgi:hypothetical protein
VKNAHSVRNLQSVRCGNELGGSRSCLGFFRKTTYLILTLVCFADASNAQELLRQREIAYSSHSVCVDQTNLAVEMFERLAQFSGITQVSYSISDHSSGTVFQLFYTEGGTRLMTTTVCYRDGTAITSDFVFR